MPIAYLQQWTGNQSKVASGTSLVLATLPANNIQLGSLVVVLFAMNNITGTVSASDDQGNTYEVVADVINTGSVRSVLLASYNQIGGVKPTITIIHPGSTARAAKAAEFSGVRLVNAKGTTNTGTTNASTATTSNAVTPAASGMLVVGLVGVEGPGGDAAPTQPAWADATAITDIGTTGSTDDTNIFVGGGFEIQTTATARTYDPTLAIARDSANCIATFYELGEVLTPGTAALTLSTFAPQLRETVTPGAATLVLTAFAPQLRETVTPAPAVLVLTTFAPTVTVTVQDPDITPPLRARLRDDGHTLAALTDAGTTAAVLTDDGHTLAAMR